ncbi:MAG: hypothetical protein J7647_08140 [Cyanobacteria bacterium SBLK]|nr:hypothetical protein [Cyanobacteria bacterium SBLK]
MTDLYLTYNRLITVFVLSWIFEIESSGAIATSPASRSTAIFSPSPMQLKRANGCLIEPFALDNAL